MRRARLGGFIGSLLLVVATSAGAQEISEELANRIGEAAEQMQNWGVTGSEDSLPVALEIATWYGLSEVGWYQGRDLLRDGREARERERTRASNEAPGVRLRTAQAAGLTCRDKEIKMANATRVVNTLDQLAGLWAAWAGWYKFTGVVSRFANPVGIGVIVLGELTLTARQYRELINAQACWTSGEGRWTLPPASKS